MARFFWACWLLLAMGSSVAQTFACQYVAAGGLDWEGGSWRAQQFNVQEPFFSNPYTRR
jgi:hypothetical protein